MTQITVAFVNRPNPQYPDMASIKGTDGVYYNIDAKYIDRYRKGQTFDAPTVVKSSKTGKQYTWIADNFDPNQGAPQPVPAAPPPPQQQAPAPAANGSARMLDAKDVQITTIALMKSFIETGKFGLTDLPMLEGACVPAAKRIVGASQ